MREPRVARVSSKENHIQTIDGPVAAGDGDAADLRESQGAVYRPSGPVYQQFGKRIVQVFTGDADAERARRAARNRQAMIQTWPNEGMLHSAQSGLVVGLVVGLGVGLVGGVIGGTAGSTVGGTVGGLVLALIFGLGSGPIFGLVGFLEIGGRACLQHLVLRLLLWRNGLAPLGYVRFLDYAAGRIFLRKVGGGYIFVHRLLMEHFAAKWGAAG